MAGAGGRWLRARQGKGWVVVSDGDALLSVFERIYIINLTHREDRRREMQVQLARIGLDLNHPKVTLFPASFPDDRGNFDTRGSRGCFESHLRVHQRIVEGAEQRVLLLEDDADFAKNFTELMAAMQPRLAGDTWDMFYSVSPVEPVPGDRDIGDGLLRLSPENRFIKAHFVGFSQAFSRAAVPYLSALKARTPGDPLGGPMHVDGAYCWLRETHPDLVVLASREPLAVQRPSRSDITAERPLWDRVPVLGGLVRSLRRSPWAVAAIRRLRGR